MRSILGIDTAGPRGSIALAENGRASAPVPLPQGGHSSSLAPSVQRLLQAHGIAVRDLAGIAVAAGPGSFTGLRIGLAWAKGAAIGARVPLLVIPSHEAAAHAAREHARRLGTLGPGERGHATVALWESGASEGGANGEPMRLLWGPEEVPEDAIIERLRGAAGGDVPVAAATEALEEWVLDLGGTLLPSNMLGPAVAELGDRALAEKRIADPRDAAPVYGRAPNARKPAARTGAVAPGASDSVGDKR
jgi:tRNA threonylcarbamoyl adenosine modification protein YeaZ